MSKIAPAPTCNYTVTPATAFTVTIGESLAEVERRLILHTVQRCRTREEAARILKISTKTLYNKLRVYEAGARWRGGDTQASSLGGTPGASSPPPSSQGNWGGHDTDKSMQ